MRLRLRQQLYVFAVYTYWLAWCCAPTFVLVWDDGSTITFHGWWC